MQKSFKRYFSLLLCVSCILLSRAAPARDAPADFLHDSWTTENGLPQNDVQLIQTRDGYLWLGTNGGLARFDGVRFTVFDTGNTPGLLSNRILALCEDGAGDLWIGTQGGGLTRHSRGSFDTYTKRDGLPDDQVFDLLSDARGHLWASTPKGLARLAGGRFEVYTTREGLPDDKAFIVGAGPDGGLWLLAGDAVVLFRDGRFDSYRAVEGFPENWARHIYSAHVDGGGGLWLATKYGLVRLADGRFEVLTARPAKGSQEAPGDAVVYVFEGRGGEVRLLTPEGVARYEGGRVLLDSRLPGLAPLAGWGPSRPASKTGRATSGSAPAGRGCTASSRAG